MQVNADDVLITIEAFIKVLLLVFTAHTKRRDTKEVINKRTNH